MIIFRQATVIIIKLSEFSIFFLRFRDTENFEFVGVEKSGISRICVDGFEF
jgi:hypothetical protein